MVSKNDLRSLRNVIDETDCKIVSLLCKRAKLVCEIGNQKEKTKENIYHPDREKEVYKKLKKILASHAEAPFNFSSLESIYREIISTSLLLEGGLSIAYLGPEASFSHVAMQACFGSQINSISCKSIPDVFRSVILMDDRGHGIVPIDNSTEGQINITLECLLQFDLKIYAEYYLPISHHLLFHKETKLESIKRLYSFRIAQEQCREWLAHSMPMSKLEIIEMPSTAAAAKRAADKKDGAAIASKLAAQYYGLKSIANNIQDSPNNITRFFVIGKKQCQPTGDDLTSIVFSLADKPGSLSQILNLFAKEGINLTKIESYRQRDAFAGYHFFIDFLGHSQEGAFPEILKKIKKQSPFFKILGSYPRIKIPVL